MNTVSERNYSAITPEVEFLNEMCVNNNKIDSELYLQHKVFRGLRDLNGKGVLTGLTEVSEINAKKEVDGKLVPCEGKLYYRGIDVEEIVKGFVSEKRFGFEEKLIFY